MPASAPGDAATLAAIDRLRPLADSWQRKQDQDVFLIKTDHQLTTDHRLTLRYNHQNFVGENFENGGAQTSIETTGASKVYTRSFNAPSPASSAVRWFNEARFSTPETANRGSEQRESAGRRPPGRDAGLRIGRNFFSPRETTIERAQVADTLTMVRGAHN